MKIEITKNQQFALLDILDKCQILGKDAEFIIELKKVIKNARDIDTSTGNS